METVEGIEVRHARTCPAKGWTDCKCHPSFRAMAFSVKSGRHRKTFPTLAAAKGWRADMQSDMRRGKVRAPTAVTVAAAAEELLAGMKAGSVPKRGGGQFKPATIRSYERALRQRVLPELGHLKLADVHRGDVQDLADGMTAAGLDASTVQNALDPLRVIFRRAMQRDLVSVDPTKGLELRTPRGGRMRIASPPEAVALLAALPNFERALYATAMYAGLRRGELRALRFEDVDLSGRTVYVRRGWDDFEGEIEVKSAAGERDVPILKVLAVELAAHKLRCGWTEGLAFGRSATTPFAKTTVTSHAQAAWEAVNERREPGEQLVPIGLHEARHTCASTFVAAGANVKQIQVLMGHANIAMTLDRYSHLFPGDLAEAAAKADAYLEGAQRA